MATASQTSHSSLGRLRVESSGSQHFAWLRRSLKRVWTIIELLYSLCIYQDSVGHQISKLVFEEILQTFILLDVMLLGYCFRQNYFESFVSLKEATLTHVEVSCELSDFPSLQQTLYSFYPSVPAASEDRRLYPLFSCCPHHYYRCPLQNIRYLLWPRSCY